MTDEDVKAEIERRCPGADAENFGKFWRVILPCRKHVGVRPDPLSLLDDLLAERDRRIAPPTPVTVSGEEERGAPPEPHPEPEAPDPVVEYIENPETQERLAEALRKLDEANAALEARKAGNDIPPADIADLIRLNESYERANERLVEGYRDAMQRAELARTRDGMFEGKSTTEWLRKAERYDSAIKWNKGRFAETI